MTIFVEEVYEVVTGTSATRLALCRTKSGCWLSTDSTSMVWHDLEILIVASLHWINHKCGVSAKINPICFRWNSVFNRFQWAASHQGRKAMPAMLLAVSVRTDQGGRHITKDFCYCTVLLWTCLTSPWDSLSPWQPKMFASWRGIIAARNGGKCRPMQFIRSPGQ